MYDLEIDLKLDKKFRKIAKSHPKFYDSILKKIRSIVKHPKRYKNLRGSLKKYKRVHIEKHFVLLYQIDEDRKVVRLVKFDNHDKIY